MAAATDTLYRLINGIAQRLCTLRTATIAAATATRATINLGGATITNVTFLASYTPTVGDTVLLLQKPGQLVILGKVK